MNEMCEYAETTAGSLRCRPYNDMCVMCILGNRRRYEVIKQFEAEKKLKKRDIRDGNK